jgi:tellurite resistance protein TerC
MDTFWLWIAFGVIVVGVLIFDLGVVGRQKRNIGLRESLLMVAGYVVLAILFGVALFVFRGADSGIEYATAYLLEESLSLDNIFIWVLIFDNLEVPEDARHKVLFWGIVGAMALRGGFIFAGAALINAFDWMLYVFGALVIYSAIRLLRSGGGKQDVGDSRILAFVRQRLKVTKDYKGEKFFVHADGRLRATPLLLALLVIELTDLVFALDSIPAIFGVTRDTLVVYSSNVFAILGLRAAYFAVAGLVEHLHYLRYGLSLLLLLVGAKMIAGGFVEIPLWLTLATTVTILGGTIGLSLLRGRAAH